MSSQAAHKVVINAGNSLVLHMLDACPSYVGHTPFICETHAPHMKDETFPCIYDDFGAAEDDFGGELI